LFETSVKYNNLRRLEGGIYSIVERRQRMFEVSHRVLWGNRPRPSTGTYRPRYLARGHLGLQMDLCGEAAYEYVPRRSVM